MRCSIWSAPCCGVLAFILAVLALSVPGWAVHQLAPGEIVQAPVSNDSVSACDTTPVLESIDKKFAVPGEILTLTGQWLDAQGSFVPTLTGHIEAANSVGNIPMGVMSWSSSTIVAQIPADAPEGPFLVNVSCRDSSGSLINTGGGVFIRIAKAAPAVPEAPKESSAPGKIIRTLLICGIIGAAAWSYLKKSQGPPNP